MVNSSAGINLYSSYSVNKAEEDDYFTIKNEAGSGSANDNLKKAKAILYREGLNQSDYRAINLILMAENALKNGNAGAADNFASRAVKLLEPANETVQNPDLQKQKIPENFIPDKKSNENTKTAESSKPATHMYQDVSSDAGVSFSYAAPLTGPQSFIAVPAHEAEHVGRRVSEAVLNGEQIMVSVSYSVKYDPRTGEPYMAGGVTRTVTLSHYKRSEASCGAYIDIYA
jgi:hypothetical protein